MFRNDICNKESHSQKANQDDAHFCYELPSKMNLLFSPYCFLAQSCSTCPYVRVWFFRIHNTRQTLPMLFQQAPQKTPRPFCTSSILGIMIIALKQEMSTLVSSGRIGVCKRDLNLGVIRFGKRSGGLFFYSSTKLLKTGVWANSLDMLRCKRGFG